MDGAEVILFLPGILGRFVLPLLVERRREVDILTPEPGAVTIRLTGREIRVGECPHHRSGAWMDGLSLALEQLVRRSEGAVRGIGARHGLGEAEIDDLFQDVRIRLWKARSGAADPLEELSPSYVYRTAISAALDLIRRRRRTPVQVPLHEGIPGPDSQGPEHALERDRLARRLEGALAQLHERRRPVVRMYLAGYAREEIAEALGWTEAKTRNLLYRGLADLKAILQAPE